MPRPRKPVLPSPPPWSHFRRAGKAAIEGYDEAARQWERIAEIPDTHIGAREGTDFIMRALTDYPVHRALITQLADALKICLESGGLTWEAEHDAEIVLARVSKSA